MHSMGIIHRNIKPSNMLLHEVPSTTHNDGSCCSELPRMIGKVSGLGLCVRMTPGTAKFKTTIQNRRGVTVGGIVGTSGYRDPTTELKSEDAVNVRAVHM